MFKFVPNLAFPAPVAVQVPGVAEPQVFTGHFVALPQSETERLQDPTADRATVKANNRAWLSAIFAGWGADLVDDDDRPVPVTDQVKGQMLDTGYIATAITMTYLREISGVARKN